MSLRPPFIGEIPEETIEVAQAAFPKGNIYMTLRDHLGVIYSDEDFKDLFAVRGQPAETPWRLALVLVMQFLENLTDRQAADAVRSRIDWKYLLGLPLRDPGFNHAVLCEFRERLVKGAAIERLLDRLLQVCREQGWLKERGKQRTDSTHIIGRARTLNRLELVGETLRHALNQLAEVAPEWLKAQVSADWYSRYGRSFEQYRLPKTETEWYALAEQIGRDGLYLLTRLYEEESIRDRLWPLAAVQTLRHVWLQQFYCHDEQVRLRAEKDLAPAEVRCQSPYDPEVRYAKKAEQRWVGYKVHLTETCDQNQPHLLIHVDTVPACQHDIHATPLIHQDLATQQLLPAEHFVDSVYADAQLRFDSQTQYGIELLSPVQSSSWQMQTPDAFDLSAFTLDEAANCLICPAGVTAYPGRLTVDATQHPMLVFTFREKFCSTCALKPRCTRGKRRTVSLRAGAAGQMLQAARQYQSTAEFRQRYAARAGIESTISLAVGPHDLRHTRYRGLRKTHLQNVATAVAINLSRLCNWLTGKPPFQERLSPFARLAVA